jgi:hypothetical protein
MKKWKWWEKIALRMTHRLWNREVSRILNQAYAKSYINSFQLHALSARFDPTQNHSVGRDNWGDW